MFIHNIDPVLINIGPLAIRYYGLVYALTAVGIFYYLRHLIKKKELVMTNEQLDSLILYLFIGMVGGGRLGYFVFYHPLELFSDPLQFFKVWQGGMAFHGAAIGGIIAILLYARKNKMEFYRLADTLAAPLALGLFFGRIANFINGELVGTPSNAPWCVVFPSYDNICRHPSQLYEAAKNLLLFGLTFYTFKHGKHLKAGLNFWLLITGYGILRTTVTFFREDPSIIGTISWGQILSSTMAVIGIIVLIVYYRKDLARLFHSNKAA